MSFQKSYKDTRPKTALEIEAERVSAETAAIYAKQLQTRHNNPLWIDEKIAPVIEGRYPTVEERKQWRVPDPKIPAIKKAKPATTGRILRATVNGWITEVIEGDDDTVTARLQAINSLKNAAMKAAGIECKVKTDTYNGEKFTRVDISGGDTMDFVVSVKIETISNNLFHL